MIILSSPTKQMDFESPLPENFQRTSDKPVFITEALMLNTLLAGNNPEDLASLMKISPAIASETFKDIQSFNSSPGGLRPALMAYAGTVFKSIESYTLSSTSLGYAQAHLRILSGLYGLLKPLDLISPYRLEMKTALEIPEEGRLSSFWKSRIASALIGDAALYDTGAVVINLASGEYSRVVDKAVLQRKVINIHFKERTEKGLKTVGMYAKTARGQMMRRIINERLLEPESLKLIEIDHYVFIPDLSSDSDWFFVR